jgi:hypothetical protein
MLAGHGRSLLQEHGYFVVPERWWGPRIWPRFLKKLDPWILSMLEAHRKLILLANRLLKYPNFSLAC